MEVTNIDLFENDKYLFMNSNYGFESFNGFGYKEYQFGVENNTSLEEYNDKLIFELTEFSNTIDEVYEKQIQSISKSEKVLERKILKKYDKAKNNYEKIVADYKKAYTKEISKVLNEYNENIKLIEKKYLKDCNKEQKNLKKNISIL